MSQNLTVKKNCVNLFRCVAGMIFLALLGIPQFVLAQSPPHLKNFNISPLQKGEFFLLSKKPGEALKVFKNLWQQEPQNNYAVRGIVRSYRALEQLPEAVSSLSQFFEENTRASSASYGLGYAFYLQGKFEESKKMLRRALGINPKNVLALNTMAAVLAELKEYETALQKVKEAIGIAPGELMFYRNLQMIYAMSGQPDKFENEYRHLLRDKDSAKAKGYGLVLAQKLRQKSFKLYADGKVDECINAIGEMLALYREIDHESGVVAGLFSLAVLYEEQGKGKLALEKYREVLEINPQHIQAREKSKLLSQKKD